ncbi:hypothetical protein LPJ75_001912 [Coemansia sp. RSA 2598]|nr:hypothetical protein LPJ75_001912 [Coemansia sp. RSA 2598]
MKLESSSESANGNYAASLSLMSDFKYPAVNLNLGASVGTQEEPSSVSKSIAESTANVYPQDIASMFRTQFSTSTGDYTSELAFCSASAGNSIMAMQPVQSLEEMQALASMPGYGNTGVTVSQSFSAATLAMAAATAAAAAAAATTSSSTPTLSASEGVFSPGRCGAGYPSYAMPGPLATDDGSSNGAVLGGGSIDRTAGMQPMSSSHSQLPYQIYAPAPLAGTTPLMTFGEEQAAALAFACSTAQASAPASVVPVTGTATGTAAFCTPIMGTAQQPGEQLFGKLDYAGMSGSAAGGLLPIAAGPVGHDAGVAFGVQGVPSLAHTPQLDRHGRQSSLALLNGYTMSPLTVASTSPMAAPAMASPMISSYFEGISLGNLSTPHLPATALHPSAHVSQAGGAVRPRIFRSLSTAGTHSRARSSSPSHLALGRGLRTTAHPYFAHSHTASGPLGNGFSVAHSRAGSEARVSRNKRASVHMDGALNIGRKLSIGSAGNSPLNKAAAASKQCAGSAVSVSSYPPSAAATADAESAEDNDDEAADKQQMSASGRIPLTSEQREVFFRWLYENAHDPKPKGHERDRLRHIGNMSRERFKTWFANARRRYFVTTQENGVLRYSVNQRFLVACQRAKIKLD